MKPLDVNKIEDDQIYRILIIGNQEFQDKIKSIYLIKLLTCHYTLESIIDESDALRRLNHNSYDLLLLQDNFTKFGSVRLATMAYAMSRPTIIICKSFFKEFYYFIWKHFSKFSNRFKTSRKLIYFSLLKENKSKLILFLIKNHLQYFDKINKEISSSTKL